MVEMLIRILDETLIDLHEPADNARAVSSARSLAHRIGFDENLQFLIATAVSELATNIIRYAGQGQVTLRIIQGDQMPGFEVIAQDAGPGMASIEEAMKDNFSSVDSLGLGLPSVKRIMDEFDVKSEPGSGTMVVARKWRT